MKTLLIIIAALSATAAYAGDINESPIRGKGAISVVHNEPACTRNCGYTTEQINAALASQGRGPLGLSRVLHSEPETSAPLEMKIETTRSWSRSNK